MGSLDHALEPALQAMREFQSELRTYNGGSASYDPVAAGLGGPAEPGQLRYEVEQKTLASEGWRCWAGFTDDAARDAVFTLTWQDGAWLQFVARPEEAPGYDPASVIWGADARAAGIDPAAFDRQLLPCDLYVHGLIWFPD